MHVLERPDALCKMLQFHSHPDALLVEQKVTNLGINWLSVRITTASGKFAKVKVFASALLQLQPKSRRTFLSMISTGRY